MSWICYTHTHKHDQLWNDIRYDGDGVTLHLETEDDGPDKTERESVIAVDDIMRTHVLQVDPLFLQKLQGLVNVLQAVDAHTTLRWLRLQTDRR